MRSHKRTQCPSTSTYRRTYRFFNISARDSAGTVEIRRRKQPC